MGSTSKPETSSASQLGKAEHEPCRELCALHVIVAREARQMAKLAAMQSGLPFKRYMEWLLFNARPMSDQAEGQPDRPGGAQEN